MLKHLYPNTRAISHIVLTMAHTDDAAFQCSQEMAGAVLRPTHLPHDQAGQCVFEVEVSSCAPTRLVISQWIAVFKHKHHLEATDAAQMNPDHSDK